jgi:type IV secretory pathway VirD2 relaxase
MVRDGDDEFRVRVGRPRSRGPRDGQRSLSFTQRVMRETARRGGGRRKSVSSVSREGDGDGGETARLPRRRSGRFNGRGRGRKAAASLPRDNAWSAPEGGMRFRARRVVVKARVVKLKGTTSRAADAHLRYLERDGVAREGEQGSAYSARENEADGQAFVERGRDDRHQFRLIVAPEDGAELTDLRAFTRDLMSRMEQDLETRLDWIAVDHHNTGHPHSHVVIRGVTDDGKILNIAGDYIAHGIRARASEVVTLELGPQSEWGVQQKLALEIDHDRFTRLDRMLLQEANENRIVDLRQGATRSYLGRVNRHVLIQRVNKLERLGLATEQEPGRWSLARDIEPALKALGERADTAAAMRLIVEGHGIERDPTLFLIHHDRVATPIVGQLISKGPGRDELSDRVHLVIDGVDGRVHSVEIADAAEVEELRRGSIVAIGPEPSGVRAADRTIAALARENDGVYRPSEHLAQARETVRVPHDDHAGYVEAHVRRLEALRRAGIVERIDGDHWSIPEDFEARTAAYEARRSRQIAVRVLSAIDLDTQVTSQGATWLDRQLVSRELTQLAHVGFGNEVQAALDRRRQHLVDEGHAFRTGDGRITYRRNLLATLAQQELMQAGEKLAQERGVPFRLPVDGERISGTFRQTVQLASGKYALIERAHEFTLVPWRPVIAHELGREVAGRVMGDSISWQFGRKRGIGM